MSILENLNKELQEAHLLSSRFPNELAKCMACGQPASIGQFCQYCHAMREELRCWPK